MGCLRGNDDDVAAVDCQCFCSDDKGDLAFLHDKDFFVGMGMERGTVAGLGVDQQFVGSRDIIDKGPIKLLNTNEGNMSSQRLKGQDRETPACRPTCASSRS